MFDHPHMKHKPLLISVRLNTINKGNHTKLTAQLGILITMDTITEAEFLTTH